MARVTQSPEAAANLLDLVATMTAAAGYCPECLGERHDPDCGLARDGRPVDRGTPACRCGHVLGRHGADGPEEAGLCLFPGCDCGEFREAPGGRVLTHWARLEVDVLGEPVPQGDLSASRSGRLYHANAKALHPWREAVASRVHDEVRGRDLLAGPVRLALGFRIGRPRAHYRTGRFAALLRPDAPAYWECAGGGDLDKLARAVLDALTGSAFLDDRQVVALEATREWADPAEGAGVTIILAARRRV